VSVCLSVYNALTFESFDLESSFLVCRYNFSIFKSRSYIDIIGSKSGAQEQKTRLRAVCLRLKGNLIFNIKFLATDCDCAKFLYNISACYNHNGVWGQCGPNVLGTARNDTKFNACHNCHILVTIVSSDHKLIFYW